MSKRRAKPRPDDFTPRGARPQESSLTPGEADVQETRSELAARLRALESENEALRHAQAQLAASRDEYAGLFERAPFGYLLLDSEGTIVQANLAAAQMLDTARHEMLGENIARFVDERSLETCSQHRQAVLESDQQQRCELTLCTRRGTPLVVRMETLAAAETQQGGKRCRTALVDISELKRTEAEIRRLNEQLEQRVTDRTAELQRREYWIRSILNAAADAIITIDRCATMVEVNPATERIFGYRGDELIGRHVGLLLPPTQRDEPYAEFLRCLESGGPKAIGVSWELAAQRKSGEIFPIELTVNEIDGLGVFIAVIRDASHRKQLERQVLEASADEQRRIAQDLHDGVGQELTGLRYLSQNLVDMLATGAPTERAHGLAQRLAGGIAMAQKQIRGALRGIMPVDIDAQGLMAALHELAARTSLYGETSCRFLCDKPVPIEDNSVATQLYRIAQEAVNNAFKHGRAKHVVIRLETDAETVELRVQDDGMGIDLARSESAGWGLRIMRYRAGLIGAKLRVEQADEGGTRVTCTLPVRR